MSSTENFTQSAKHLGLKCNILRINIYCLLIICRWLTSKNKHNQPYKTKKAYLTYTKTFYMMIHYNTFWI